MTVTKKPDDDCYTVSLKRVQAWIGVALFLLAVGTPAVVAYGGYLQLRWQVSMMITRDEANRTFLTRSAADNITGQRNAQLQAVNDNIVAVARNQDVLNANLSHLMGKLGVEHTAAMSPIPHPTLPLLRNPEPAEPAPQTEGR